MSRDDRCVLLSRTTREVRNVCCIREAVAAIAKNYMGDHGTPV